MLLAARDSRMASAMIVEEKTKTLGKSLSLTSSNLWVLGRSEGPPDVLAGRQVQSLVSHPEKETGARFFELVLVQSQRYPECSFESFFPCRSREGRSPMHVINPFVR